jgi:hypothetical protein
MWHDNERKAHFSHYMETTRASLPSKASVLLDTYKAHPFKFHECIQDGFTLIQTGGHVHFDVFVLGGHDRGLKYPKLFENISSFQLYFL